MKQIDLGVVSLEYAFLIRVINERRGYLFKKSKVKKNRPR
jgi:hypothetical protein